MEVRTIIALLERCNSARRARDFTAPDRTRDLLATPGVTLKEGPDGTRWRYSL